MASMVSCEEFQSEGTVQLFVPVVVRKMTVEACARIGAVKSAIKKESAEEERAGREALPISARRQTTYDKSYHAPVRLHGALTRSARPPSCGLVNPQGREHEIRNRAPNDERGREPLVAVGEADWCTDDAERALREAACGGHIKVL